MRPARHFPARASHLAALAALLLAGSTASAQRRAEIARRGAAGVPVVDGAKTGTIQNIPGSARMGRGTVRVAPSGAGARFEVEGQSQHGDAIRATIACASFTLSEGAGG